MNSSISATLKSINISYLFAKNLDHGISYLKSNWQLFEPTKFVYSFFTFNMLYDIDWNTTFQRDQLKDSEHRYTSVKIVQLLKFIYTNDIGKPFLDYYQEYDINLSIVNNASRIIPDDNIKKTDKNEILNKKQSYLSNYLSSIENLKKGVVDFEDHYKLIIFTYQIRNNMFHGLKKATEIIKSGQRERLQDYSNIILATIELFFNILKSRYYYYLATEDELKENIRESPFSNSF